MTHRPDIISLCPQDDMGLQRAGQYLKKNFKPEDQFNMRVGEVKSNGAIAIVGKVPGAGDWVEIGEYWPAFDRFQSNPKVQQQGAQSRFQFGRVFGNGANDVAHIDLN